MNVIIKMYIFNLLIFTLIIYILFYNRLSQYIFIKFNNEWISQVNLNFSGNKHFFKRFKFFIDNCLIANNEGIIYTIYEYTTNNHQYLLIYYLYICNSFIFLLSFL